MAHESACLTTVSIDSAGEKKKKTTVSVERNLSFAISQLCLCRLELSWVGLEACRNGDGMVFD